MVSRPFYCHFLHLNISPNLLPYSTYFISEGQELGIFCLLVFTYIRLIIQ